MKKVKQIFWNNSEQRLRFLWRVIIFIFLFAMLTAGAQAALFVLAPDLSPGIDSGPDAQFLMGWALSEWLMLVALAATLLVVGRWVDRRPWWDYGFRLGPRWWKDFGFGLVLGALLMTGIFLVERALGWVTITGTMQGPGDMTFAQGVLWAALLFFAVGIFEETLSRGWLLHNLAEGLNFKFWNPAIALVLAWALTSALFGLAHAGNPNATIISTLNLILAGIFLGLGYVLTGDLAIPIGLHMTWNFFQGNVFGFPSGTSSNMVSFIAIEQRGPDAWTGGAFGPEAGLIGVIAVLAGMALTLAWVKWQYGRVQLQQTIPLAPNEDLPVRNIQ
ncbi:MAG: CPBP family intramembrane metalloprotease [Chloroflexi bacterium]|nr:CPBP family intramembrane metalloprotease [Chloroflexota bacterium]